MSIATAHILVALTTAVPATIAAVAAWKSAKRTKTHNGMTAGQTIETVYYMVREHLLNEQEHHIHSPQDQPKERGV